ncbi:MAG: hypothetical protein U9N77_14490 [Thermodesulfobacteriota bacterium]|nr:hypothetical protein [Thermodesulfobacteriota bacterium]
MKKLILFAFVMTLFGICTTSLFAKDWRSVFVAALEKGKTVELPAGQTPAEGLAYTPPEEVVLEEAVAKAMEEKAPACECMKIAIDYEYNPYLVLKNIYSSGGDVELDQLCMCATEAGVMKAIIANAAADAVSSLDEPVFDRDEISQSQCLGGEEGLAYTAAVRPLPVSPVDNSGNRNYASKSTP